MAFGFPRRSRAGLVLALVLVLVLVLALVDGRADAATTAAGTTSTSTSATEDYKQVLAHLLIEHKRVAAARADLSGAHSAVSVARSAWYPDLSLTASLGHQTMAYTNGTPNTALDTHSLTFGLRQTLWDFGAIDAGIDKADIGVRQSEATLAQVTQDLLLEGLTAYITLNRARRTEAFAEQSVTNIEKQTGMEESLVQLGGGFTSDVLQAKSQLAGAEARLVRAKGDMVNAVNRYRAVFGREPDDAPPKAIPVAFDLLPPALPAAVSFALTHNRQLEVLRLTAQGSHVEVDRISASQLYPNIHALAQRIQDHNPDGIDGGRTQEVVKVEMTYQFNTGLGGFHAVDAARSAAESADDKYSDLRDLIEEQVRDAWQNLDSARQNAHFLENQVRIVGEFLRLAREERLQGRRSLIDVLTGETSLINAQSDSASADADVAVAAFTLFRATGLLDLSLLR
jgi:adhesin transport system outer membrane protein